MHTIRPRVLVALLGALVLLVPAVPARSASASTLTGHWTFDEGSGTVANDSSAGGHPLTLQNGASWGPGVVGPSALSLSGSGQYAEAASALIDTTHSFTVSAWVNLSNTNGYQTFVSQDGSQVSGFYLQLRGDTNRFAFTRIAYDSPAGLGTIASAPSIIPQPGEWYHLTGVYDSVKQTISLYVNGTLQQTQSFVPNWQASGPFAVGRGFFNGNQDGLRLRQDRRRPDLQRRRRRPDDLAARGPRRAHGRRLAGGPGDQPNAVRRVPGGDQPLGRRRPVRGTDP